MLTSSIKNKVHTVAALSSWVGAASNGAINAGQFTIGPSSRGSMPSINGNTGIRFAGNGSNRSYANKNNGPSDTVSSSTAMTLDDDHTYTIEFKSRSNGRRKHILIWLELRAANGQWLANYYDTHCTSPNAGEETSHITVLSFAKFTGIKTAKIAFGQHFEADDPLNPNSTTDMTDFYVRDHGSVFSSSEVWASTPPAVKDSYTSGKMEIRPDGSTWFDGVQETYRGSYPDWAGGVLASFEKHQAVGYNMAFQMGAALGAGVTNLVPPTMLVSCDISLYANSTSGSFGDISGFESKYRAFLGAVGDRCRILYVDIEHGIWDAHEVMTQLKNKANEVADDLGTFRRPLFGVCGAPAGFEAYRDELDGMIPYGSNSTNTETRAAWPLRVSGTGDCWAPLEIHPSPMTLLKHPQLTTPLPFTVFNTPLNGGALDNAVLNNVAYGVGTGHTHHRDWPERKSNCGLHGWGYEDQPWWNDAAVINGIMPSLMDLLASDYEVEFNATLPNSIPSSTEGVTRHFRVVGPDKVVAILVNNTNEVQNFTVTMPEDVDSASTRYARGVNYSMTNAREMSVQMEPLSSAAIELLTDEVEPTDYTLSITAPPCGSEASPAPIPAGQNTTTYDFSLSPLTGVARQRLVFYRVNNDQSLTEIGHQVPATVTAVGDVTPTTDYIEGDLIRVDYQIEGGSGAVLATAAPCFYRVGGAATERRCVTLDQTLAQGGSTSWSLVDLDDGQGGTPARFIVVSQPANGSFSVSSDGLTLTATINADGQGTSCGAVDVEYSNNG